MLILGVGSNGWPDQSWNIQSPRWLGEPEKQFWASLSLDLNLLSWSRYCAGPRFFLIIIVIILISVMFMMTTMISMPILIKTLGCCCVWRECKQRSRATVTDPHHITSHHLPAAHYWQRTGSIISIIIIITITSTEGQYKMFLSFPTIRRITNYLSWPCQKLDCNPYHIGRYSGFSNLKKFLMRSLFLYPP